MPLAAQPEFGALVISLDFELHWGVRDWTPADGRYRDNLLGARTVIPRILDLFVEFEVAATWATVGFLFARSHEDLDAYRPAVVPRYANERLNPYDEPVGLDEQDDPLHYAPSLIERIHATPRQEIATHTYSHYYCLEPGQDQSAFREDLRSALRIARSYGIDISSIVFPRNQLNPNYADCLLEAGIRMYRGNPRTWGTTANQIAAPRARVERLADAHINIRGHHLSSWDSLAQEDGLVSVPASYFLMPCRPASRLFDQLRLGRINASIENAATQRRIIHIWWHPHNFGKHPDINLSFLRRILEKFAQCREASGMRSLPMRDTWALVQ